MSSDKREKKGQGSFCSDSICVNNSWNKWTMMCTMKQIWHQFKYIRLCCPHVQPCLPVLLKTKAQKTVIYFPSHSTHWEPSYMMFHWNFRFVPRRAFNLQILTWGMSISSAQQIWFNEMLRYRAHRSLTTEYFWTALIMSLFCIVFCLIYIAGTHTHFYHIYAWAVWQHHTLMPKQILLIIKLDVCSRDSLRRADREPTPQQSSSCSTFRC